MAAKTDNRELTTQLLELGSDPFITDESNCRACDLTKSELISQIINTKISTLQIYNNPTYSDQI